MSSNLYPIIVNPNPTLSSKKPIFFSSKVLVLIILLLLLTGITYLFLSDKVALPDQGRIEEWSESQTPIVIKKIDKNKGTGEFVLNDPAKTVPFGNPEAQIIIEGEFNSQVKELKIKASKELSYIDIHNHPRVSQSYLILELYEKDSEVSRIIIPLTNPDENSVFTFKTHLPFTPNPFLKVFDKESSLLFSENLVL